MCEAIIITTYMVDVDQLTSTMDAFYILNKLITRFKAKTLKEVLNELVV
jgi:hypothetical protein